MEGRRIRKDEAGRNKGKRKDERRSRRQAEVRGQKEDERRKRRKEERGYRWEED